MIGALILGLFAGFIGRALLPGKQDVGFLMTIVLGLAGAALGWLFFTKLLGIGDDDAFDLGGLPGAAIGAVVLLFAYERFAAGRAPASAGAAPVDAREREERRAHRAGERAQRGERSERPERGERRRDRGEGRRGPQP